MIDDDETNEPVRKGGMFGKRPQETRQEDDAAGGTYDVEEAAVLRGAASGTQAGGQAATHADDAETQGGGLFGRRSYDGEPAVNAEAVPQHGNAQERTDAGMFGVTDAAPASHPLVQSPYAAAHREGGGETASPFASAPRSYDLPTRGAEEEADAYADTTQADTDDGPNRFGSRLAGQASGEAPAYVPLEPVQSTAYNREPAPYEAPAVRRERDHLQSAFPAASFEEEEGEDPAAPRTPYNPVFTSHYAAESGDDTATPSIAGAYDSGTDRSGMGRPEAAQAEADVFTQPAYISRSYDTPDDVSMRGGADVSAPPVVSVYASAPVPEIEMPVSRKEKKLRPAKEPKAPKVKPERSAPGEGDRKGGGLLKLILLLVVLGGGGFAAWKFYLTAPGGPMDGGQIPIGNLPSNAPPMLGQNNTAPNAPAVTPGDAGAGLSMPGAAPAASSGITPGIPPVASPAGDPTAAMPAPGGAVIPAQARQANAGKTAWDLCDQPVVTNVKEGENCFINDVSVPCRYHDYYLAHPERSFYCGSKRPLTPGAAATGR